MAGLSAADHMYELDAPIFEVARELEGHPDNVAAALYGGFVVCAGDEPACFDPPAGLEGVIAIPPDPVATSDARAALPAEIPLTDAVHNVAHAALLVLGLASDDFSLIGRGLSDRVHQDRRARALSPLDGAAGPGAGAGRGGCHDLGRGADGSLLVSLAADGRPAGRSAPSAPATATCAA